MRVSCWIAFILLTAWLADIAFYGGVHADATAKLARGVAHGILLGLRQYV